MFATGKTLFGLVHCGGTEGTDVRNQYGCFFPHLNIKNKFATAILKLETFPVYVVDRSSEVWFVKNFDLVEHNCWHFYSTQVDFC